MIRFTGRRVVAPLAAAAAALLTAQTPAAALTPATLAGIVESRAESAEFRFPWEAEAKPRRRAKRPERAQRGRSKKPAISRRAKDKKPAAPAERSAKPAPMPADPMDAALPPAAGPLDVAPPRGTTRREADEWAAVAAQVPPPRPVPLLSEDGPAPAPASVVALMATRPEAPATRPASPSPAEEDETPDIHVPLPPTRPSAPPAAAAVKPPLREGLAPEGGLAPDGQGLAPEGEGLAPEGGLAREHPPLPPTRPGGVAGLSPEAPLPPEPPPQPTAPDIALPVVAHDDDPDCRALADDGIAEAERIPPIEGPGVCGGGPLVSLTGVKRRDGTSIKLKPAATLRCSMAKSVAAFLRDDVAPAAEGAGAALVRLDIAGSFQCRGRNGAAGGKMSEHGRANAIDLSGFAFADGKAFGVFSPELPKALSDKVRAAACERFSTVLGPGSDGFHEEHLHLDLQPRRTKSKLCQWSDPAVAAVKSGGSENAAKAKDDKADEDEPTRKSAARPKPQASP